MLFLALNRYNLEEFDISVETDVALDNLDFIFSREGRGYNQVSCVCRDNCGVHHFVVLPLCHRLALFTSYRKVITIKFIMQIIEDLLIHQSSRRNVIKC